MRALQVLLLTVVVSGILVVGCVEKKPQQTTKRESPVTARLREMVSDMDFMLSSGTMSQEQQYQVLDKYRREIYDFMAQALIREADDLHRAAIVLQQATGPEYAETCLLSHHLAMRAVEKGGEKSRFLAAVALDRYLLFSGEEQKYGTQYYNDSTGQLVMLPTDSTTTDAERAEWNVAPLNQLRQMQERRLDPSAAEPDSAD